MDYSGRVFTGRKHNYKLGNPVKDGQGGEGTVYLIKGHPGLVAKVYHEKVLNRSSWVVDAHRRKLECMLKYKIQIRSRGRLRIAWPTDILLDGGRMVGFVMPRVRSEHGLYKVWMQDIQDKIFPKYTWRKSVRVARSLAQAVASLHENNVVLGDLNPKNFLVDRAGNVILVDTDSYDITDPDTGERFPCQVARAEMLAPELQSYGNLAVGRAPFTKETDRFSLAILIFRLLMGGFHPFGCACVAGAVSSSAGITEQTEIVNGNCAYVRNVFGRTISPMSPKLDFLPTEIRSLFDNTFNYTAYSAKSRISSRATAAQWDQALGNLNHRLFHRCRSNKRHVFPGPSKCCPFCNAKRKSRFWRILLAASLSALLIRVQSTIGLRGLADRTVEIINGGFPAVAVALDEWFAQIEALTENLFASGQEAPSSEALETAPQEEEICLLPTNRRLLSDEDVEGMTREEIQMAINEIYARYGRDFGGGSMQEYFESTGWYTPQPGLTDEEIIEMLSEVEWENLEFLIRRRNELS